MKKQNLVLFNAWESSKDKVYKYVDWNVRMNIIINASVKVNLTDFLFA